MRIFDLMSLAKKFIFLLVILEFISACSSATTPHAYVRKNHDQPGVKKVAIFSFHNNTMIAEASKIVTGAFVASLVKTKKFKVEFPGNIKSFLVNERIIVRTGVDLDTIKRMGRRLGVDAVIMGRIEEFVGMEEKKRGVIPVVSISSRLVDVRTGKILWMAQHRRTGDDYIKVLDFGKVRSVGELTKKMVLEMIETMP
ncbi:MAG: CsgG/HfaB family protein [Deltaproteobacteria bacterium]|nr:CsgG/HfaB family protein [Deltaproteobacteria bacterium]